MVLTVSYLMATEQRSSLHYNQYKCASLNKPPTNPNPLVYVLIFVAIYQKTFVAGLYYLERFVYKTKSYTTRVPKIIVFSGHFVALPWRFSDKCP